MRGVIVAFVALARLRFGDGWIEPGETVPVEDGRGYDAMVLRGEVALVPDGAAGTPAEPDVSAKDRAAKLKRPELDKAAADAGVPNKDAVAEAIADREALAALARVDLDKRAALAGVDAPDKLPNKQAVIDAVQAAKTDGE